MFDLKKSIMSWRSDVISLEAVSPEDVEELEDHLNQEILSLVELGLSEKEAFWVATERMGNISVLGNEYRKVNGPLIWTRRLMWMLAGYLLFLLLTNIVQAASDIFAGFTLSLESGHVTSLLIYITSNVLMLAGILWGVNKINAGQQNHFARLVQFLQAKPILAIVLTGLSFALLHFIGIAAPGIMSRFVTPNDWGQYIVGISIYDMLVSLLFPVGVAALIFRLRKLQITPVK